MIEESLVSMLKTKCQNVYARSANPEGKDLPALVYSRVTCDVENAHDFPSVVNVVRFQVDCYATNFKTARDLAKDVEGISGRVDGYVMFAKYILDAYEAETGVYRAVVDVTILS